MMYHSLNNNQLVSSFKDAVISGIAPDKGLYFPIEITPLPTSFFRNIGQLSQHEIAFEAIKQFVGEDINTTGLKEIIARTLDFEFPIVEISDNLATLELFHGPTMAFKDVGARFMANCLGYFFDGSSQEVTVLVATSGDTGGAVANGFLGVEGVKVVILYPKGKVSAIQEKQLTTLGRNITALEVNGTFDDCQAMVKNAFLDDDIIQKRRLTSANSINIARWLPQMFYYLFAYQQTKQVEQEVFFSVPSGNFGNICAGLVAQRLGMPVTHFVAATNVNDVVPNYMTDQHYVPQSSISTISNAMDVGDPSNFIRIRKLFENDFERLSANFSSFSFSDEQTRAAMQNVFADRNYIMDPHGAVGYLGAKKFQEDHPDHYGIFLETAHPVKFLPVVETTLGQSPEIPSQILAIMHKQKVAVSINNYKELRAFLTAD